MGSVTTKMQLRYYQQACIDAIYNWYSVRDDNPLCVLATGTGKSVIIAKLIQEIIEAAPSERIINCIDTRELVEQNYEQFINLWPFAPAGIYSAGLNRRDQHSQILFCGIQSVYKKAFKLGRTDTLIIDECHMLSLKTSSMWQQFITDLKKMNPNFRIIGLTATPYRMDSGLLHTGDGAIFGGIAYEYGIKEGIADGYLAPIIPKRMETRLSVEGVGKRGGEYIESQLQKAVDKEEITKAAVAEIIEYGKYRNKWLVFGSGVEHCYHISDAIKGYGVTCEVIEGNTPSQQRTDIIKAYKNDEIKCLVNNAVLTKGFDEKRIDLIAALRPTESPVLWTQCVGRGLRIHPDKKDCLLLDFAQNVSRFGYLDEMVFRDKRNGSDGEKGVPPMKHCPECNTIMHISIMECTCGYKFPPPEPKIDKKAYDGAILSTQVEPEYFDVQDVYIYKHKGKKGVNMLRIEYVLGMFERVSEYVCLEHEGFAKEKAVLWWVNNTDGYKIKCFDAAALWVDCKGIPRNADEAVILQESIIIPKTIGVKKIKGFDTIVYKSQESFAQSDQMLAESNQFLQSEHDEIAF